MQGPSPRGRGNHACRSRLRSGRRDHPRAGGETDRHSDADRAAGGAIPARAGKPAGRCRRDASGGAIPARAGKPCAARHRCRRARDHPRAGGEPEINGAWEPRRGPSPRGRGNHCVQASAKLIEGPSPRGRGNRAYGLRRGHALRDHPRAGGETSLADAATAQNGGPSPRGRGNHEHSHRQTGRIAGPSPRGRGNRLRRHPMAAVRDHPRAGGETQAAAFGATR